MAGGPLERSSGFFTQGYTCFAEDKTPFKNDKNGVFFAETESKLLHQLRVIKLFISKLIHKLIYQLIYKLIYEFIHE